MKNIMRIYIRLLLCMAPFGVSAQDQNCLRDAVWPSSYTARTTGSPGALVTQIVFDPPINAEVLYSASRTSGEDLILDLSMIDNCSGYGARPVQRVVVTVPNAAPGAYLLRAQIEQVGFGFVVNFPSVEFSGLTIGSAVSIPLMQDMAKILLLAILLLSALRSVFKSRVGFK